MIFITDYQVNMHAYQDLPDYTRDWPLNARKSARVKSLSANKGRHFTTTILWIGAEWVYVQFPPKYCQNSCAHNVTFNR